MNTNPDNHSTPSGNPQADGDNNPQNVPQSETEDFAPVIFSYTRKMALADGVQVDVSKMAKEAGFNIPVFMTDTVFNEYVKVPADVEGQDEEGRLRDILRMLNRAIQRVPMGSHEVRFPCYVKNSMTEPETTVMLYAVCATLDIDDPAPSITIMLPDEN